MICIWFGLPHYSVSRSQGQGLCLICLYIPRIQQCTVGTVITLKTLVGITLDWVKVGNTRIPCLFHEIFIRD